MTKKTVNFPTGKILSAGREFFNGIKSLYEHEKVLVFEKKLKKAFTRANKNRKERLTLNKEKKDKDRYVGYADTPLKGTKSNYKQTDVAFDIISEDYPSFLRVWSEFERPESQFNFGMVQFMIHRGVQFPQTKGNRFLGTEFVPNILVDFFKDWILKDEDKLFLFVACVKVAEDSTLAFDYRKSKKPDKKGTTFSLEDE